ncbi:delta-lactam-biosynthetic de-N-acetylase [Lachnospiraceae bacterium NSJ-143]|nr:delta-lactam-biosynthetic de-N-acetylase [Lachnospiraceae bacterium NSJ-143]
MVSRLAAYAITAAVTVSQSLTYQPSYAEETAGETAATEVLQPEFDYEAIKAMMPPQPEENSPLVGYNDKKSWWFSRNTTKTPPSAQHDINISQYDSYYLGDVSRKVIYLTFDEGYENGCTSQILDVLKENDVKAAFFVTKSYIKSEPELVKRMVAEGHVVGNHSVTHPDLTAVSDEQIASELNGCADYFKEVTGQDMPPFFRPPEGAYSIRTLEKTKELGYKTIFWSFAYRDWLVDDQPSVQEAHDYVLDYSHNGCIMLLHAVSEANTGALDSIIKDLKSQGYEFESLYRLP